MTKREAIKILDTIPTIGEQVDALEIAIKSLEAWDFIEKDFCNLVCRCIIGKTDNAYVDGLATGLEIFRKYLRKVEE